MLSIAPISNNCRRYNNKKHYLHEIEEALQGKINDATRIDVCAHGRIDPMDPTKSHIIALGKNYFDISPTYTSSLFAIFNKANHGNPIYTHLWSCYADNANKEFSYLPESDISFK